MQMKQYINILMMGDLDYYDKEETKENGEATQWYETQYGSDKNSSSYISVNSTSNNFNTGDTMTQYREMIEKKRKQLQAEEWAQGVKQIHVHSLNSMWYEPNPIKIKSRKTC